MFPDAHIADYRALPAELRGDIHEYLSELARNSVFFREMLGKNESGS
jgi:hypothetical protein